MHHLPDQNPRTEQNTNSTFTLAQRDDAGHTTGATLWLGAQCLSLYLATLPNPRTVQPRAIELGAGIGLTALALASLGYHVLATDVPTVLPLLSANIRHNLAALPTGSGEIVVREMDWFVPPEQWDWSNPDAICSVDPRTLSSRTMLPDEDLRPPFDLIVTADTLYAPELTEPLLRSLHALAKGSVSGLKSVPVYICLERRDPALIDRALESARDRWGFTVERVPPRKMVKAMEKGGTIWAKEDWEGVEIWKMTLKS